MPYTGFFYIKHIIVKSEIVQIIIKYKTFAKCLVGMYFFSDPFWTINVQNISMCNAAVNAFWSSARIDAEKKEEIQDETETSLAVY